MLKLDPRNMTAKEKRRAWLLAAEGRGEFDNEWFFVVDSRIWYN